MFLLGRHAILGQEPPIYLRSTTATRLSSPANVHAATVEPVPPPRITRSNSRRERLWIQQKRLRSSRPGAITPRSKDSVARHNASREVRNIVEGRTLAGDNHVSQQRLL